MSEGLRPIGTLPVNLRNSNAYARQVSHRSPKDLDDGQQVRVVAHVAAPIRTDSEWKHDYVDVVLPAIGGEYATGLVLRFVHPVDLAAFLTTLDEAQELLEEKRAPEFVTVPEGCRQIAGVAS